MTERFDPARSSDPGRTEDEPTRRARFDQQLAAAQEAQAAGDVDTAKALLDQALRYVPSDQRARNLLGLTLFKLGDLEQAETIYRALIDDHPADPTLRVNLGLVYLKRGASLDAARCFTTALELQPEHIKAQNYLGLALAQKGDHAAARGWFLRSGNAAMAERMEELAAAQAEALAREQAAADAQAAAEAQAAAQARAEAEAQTAAEARAAAQAQAADEAARAQAAHASRAEAGSIESALAGSASDAAAQPAAARPFASTIDGVLVEEISAPPEAFASARGPAGRTAALGAAPQALEAFTREQRLALPGAQGSFFIGPNSVVIQVRGEMLTRLDGLIATWGTATLRGELKRFRGKPTEKSFGEGLHRMLRASGEGRYVIASAGRSFTALELADEPAYFREEALFAFEDTLVFENGRVPGRIGGDLHLVHLRGQGRLLLTSLGSIRSVDVRAGEPLRIPMDQLVGWHGPQLQPRLVNLVEEAPEMGVALELSGEGRALVDTPDER